MDLLYRKLQQDIKSQIVAGIFQEGDLMPAESELQKLHGVTRSTVRQALGELVKEGYIEKQQGKGSIVMKRQRRTLGRSFFFPLNDLQKKAGCIHLRRLRCVNEEPVMLETTYIPNMNLPRFCKRPFVKGSLFETLIVNYLVEINRVEQDLRAIQADKEVAAHLGINPGSPLLHIYLKLYTNREYLAVFSSLLCKTDKYSISNIL